MKNYQTIQKTSQEIGIDESLILSMLKRNELSKFKIKGRKRVLIDRDELEALIEPISESVSFDFENFEI